MKVYLVLPMALASIAFAVAGTSTWDMSTTTFMEQNVDLRVNRSARITGRKLEHTYIIPFHCSLRENDNHICGCTIMNKDFILTAAQCVLSDPTLYSVVVGTSLLNKGGSHHIVQTVYIKPTFSKLKDDIAVLKLKMSINMTLPNREAVTLATPKDKVKNWRYLLIFGWGITSDGAKKMSNTLRATQVKLLPRKRCRKVLKKEYITSKVICTEGKNTGTCKAVSGGALIAILGKKWIQVGIASFPLECSASPAVFTKVSAYRSWISNVTHC